MDAALETSIRAKLAAGDHRGAATDAVRGYGPQILGYLRRVLRDEQAAAEAFSLFCELLWKQLPQYRGEAAFLTWAYHLAWGSVLRLVDDPFRKRGRRLRTTEVSKLALEVASSTARVHFEQESAIERLRAQLTPEEQTLLILRIDKALHWREIAEVLAGDAGPEDEATLRKRFERVKTKVRKLAEAEGLVTAR